MKNLKIGSLLFICCFLCIVCLNSFNSKPQQDCSPDFIKGWNSKLRKESTVANSLPGYENCVQSQKNPNPPREPYLVDAYKNLGEYYRSRNKDKVQQYIRLIAEEFKR
jgi:hypothetical protein